MWKEWLLPAVVITVALTIWAKNPELFGRLRGDPSRLKGLSDPKILITLGLIVFNLVSWAMIPWWWDILTDKWYTFVFFNVGVWSVLFLRTIKTKGADGKDTKENNPTASKMASVIALVLVVGLATIASEKVRNWWTEKTQSKSLTSLTYGVPVEVAKKVICECESGCQQFEVDKDGKFITDTKGNKIPYKNRGIPEKDIPPSSAFGKYQFLEVHREPANKLDHNLDTEEGQEKYFEHLYEKEGFGPWDHDQKYGGGRACWGPKLAALGYGAQESPELLDVVDVPTSEWSDVVVNTYLSKISWGRLDTSKGGDCVVMMDGDSQKVFNIKGTHPEITPRTVQFKCTESGAKVRVRKVPNA